MATKSFHRRIIGKWKLTIFAKSLGIFDFFTEMFNEKSFMFHGTFVQIA